MRETPNCQGQLFGGDQPGSWKATKSTHFWGFKDTFLLGYHCFILLCQFLLYNKVNQLYVYIYPHFFLDFIPFRSLQSNKESSLCYRTGSHQLSFLFVLMYICQYQFPKSSQTSLPHLVSMVFSTSASLFLSHKQVQWYNFFQNLHINIQYLFFSF